MSSSGRGHFLPEEDKRGHQKFSPRRGQRRTFSPRRGHFLPEEDIFSQKRTFSPRRGHFLPGEDITLNGEENYLEPKTSHMTSALGPSWPRLQTRLQMLFSTGKYPLEKKLQKKLIKRRFELLCTFTKSVLILHARTRLDLAVFSPALVLVWTGQEEASGWSSNTCVCR